MQFSRRESGTDHTHAHSINDQPGDLTQRATTSMACFASELGATTPAFDMPDSFAVPA